MSTRTAVQVSLDGWARSAGMHKRSGSWYRSSDEVIQVVNQQKSQYGPRYYVNVAFWLVPLGQAAWPQEHHCHLRTRLDTLLPDLAELIELLLDLDVPMDDVARNRDLSSVFDSRLSPALDATATIDGFRGPDGLEVRERCLVTGPAQRLLGARPEKTE